VWVTQGLVGREIHLAVFVDRPGQRMAGVRVVLVVEADGHHVTAILEALEVAVEAVALLVAPGAGAQRGDGVPGVRQLEGRGDLLELHVHLLLDLEMQEVRDGDGRQDADDGDDDHELDQGEAVAVVPHGIDLLGVKVLWWDFSQKLEEL
tara:strand:+ start:8794 stop:9243 length:450 start_codon:yes stop_codon:yes gene_type:complete